MNKFDIIVSMGYSVFYNSTYPLSTVAVIGTYVDTKYSDKNDMRLTDDG
jgi:hypothetical protein